MSDLPLQKPMETITGRRFSKVAAIVSIFSSIVVIIIFTLIYVSLRSHNRMILGSIDSLLPISLLLILGGIVLGILSIVLSKKNQRHGVFWKALTGICINGLLLLLIVGYPILLSFTSGNNHFTTPQGRLDSALKTLNTASDEAHKFYALNDACKESFEVGKIEDARRYSEDLLALAPKFQSDWNYGNAIHDGNLVLGRIAVREGRIEDAKDYLLAAGKSPGSPQLNSFGPNMSLARDLLEKGERDSVLQYFELCRKFWEMGTDKLNEWSQEVKLGNIPHFGANLVY